MGKEYSTTVQIIAKDDRGKAIVWPSVSCMTFHHVSDKKNSINSQSAFCTQSAVCILYWLDWYYCFCSGEPQVWTEILELEKKILVRLSWLLWLMCGLYVEELPRTSTMIEQWLLYTNWRWTQMHDLPIWLPLMLFCVVTACVEMNPLWVPKSWTFWLLDSSCIFRSLEMWFEVIILLNHTNVHENAWVSEFHFL